MREVFRQSKAFFSLCIDDKMTVKVDKNNRGYTPMHDQALDPENQTKGDTKVNGNNESQTIAVSPCRSPPTAPAAGTGAVTKAGVLLQHLRVKSASSTSGEAVEFMASSLCRQADGGTEEV